MNRRWQLPTLVFAMLSVLSSPSRADLPAYVSDAVAWYDTLGYPDVKDLPYVRARTGAFGKMGDQPFESDFVEGFLVSEDASAFTVFICSVPEFKEEFASNGPYPLTTVRFVRKTDGPAYTHVDYEVLDFDKVSSEALDRVRRKSTNEEGLCWTRPRIFAFARACMQKRLSEKAAALMELAANIPDEQTGKKNPLMLRDQIQEQMGESILQKADEDAADTSISWAELLKAYENFGARFPASKRIAYAKETADMLKKMISEAEAHHPKPLDQMSPAEQVAENIYQLRYLGDGYSLDWIMYSHYPVDARTWTWDHKQVVTPVHRLVDLGDKAVPQLIDALNDRQFTRSTLPTLHGNSPVLRVGDVAQIILEHMSGRNFSPVKTDDGKLVHGTARQQAEAWWADVQSNGEKQILIKTAD